MKPIIRRMTDSDLPAILEIEHTVFSDPWRRESFEFEVHVNKFSFPVVMEWKGKIIGYAVAWEIFEEFHIADIAVHPDYQGQGWGKHLLEFLLQRARRIGAQYAMLEVRPTNRRAIDLYRKYGFHEVGRRIRYYRDGEDALVMKKNLISQLEGNCV